MTKLYEDQLKAIREILANSSREVRREGYHLLFKLWLENMDNPEFQRDLLPIVVENFNVINEIEDRIDDMVIKEGITDVYLRLRLKKLVEEAEEYKLSASKEKNGSMISKKLFISYSHKDEDFKDELITMLAGLQRQGIINPWQDRRIEAGTDWFDSIRHAMEECNIAVLLVSPNFIA
jgi:hypothetical protein